VRAARLYLSIFIMTALLFVSSAGAATRPFTVKDSIEMTRITEPDVGLAAYLPVDFNWSPDGKRVVMVTRRGELATNLNHYELRVYSREELRAALRTPVPPTGRVVLSIATSSFRHGIEQVTWDAESRFLFCIARKGDDIGQVYEIDVASGSAQKVTASETEVRRYAVTGDRQRILYLAPLVPDWSERDRRGYVVGSRTLHELALRNPSELDTLFGRSKLGHHLLDRRSGKLRLLDLTPSMLDLSYSLSNDSRFALYPVQVYKMPDAWREYDFYRHWRERGEQSLLDNGVALAPIAEVDGVDPTFGPALWTTQFHIIDLETGTSRPLLDAPMLISSQQSVVAWATDASSVILSDTYLPLTGVSSEEARHRRKTRIIAEVDLRNGAVLPIADQPMVASDGSHRLDLFGIDRRPDGSIEIRERPSHETRATVTRYVKSAGRWAKISMARETAASTGLQLEVRQDANTHPDVFVRDLATGRSARVTKLNPQLHELSLGHVEYFDWQDRYGHRFHGGLFFPPDYVRGKRLPVVLQTYGFRDDEFIVDGPNSVANASAARALVNQGILVLQMPELALPRGDNWGTFESPGENELYLAGLEAALDALDSRGYIDPDKVGLAGWSREGLHVQYVVTFSSHPVAAAIISDSATATPLCYAQGHGMPQPGVIEFERYGTIGASPWGKGMEQWLERSPAFHYDRIRAPLRLEHIGYAIPCVWDMYAVLSRHRRPVELVHLPREDHSLQTPWGRYTAQQGAVDWFTFWLNGTEDLDPAKQEQYKRWRVFREQQAIATKTQVPSQGQ
jgi:dipeptidyl aminopeptidase/acylaminoacyl peptidase